MRNKSAFQNRKPFSPLNHHTTPIRVLLIEDDPEDAQLLREMLAEAKGTWFDVEWVDRVQAGLDRLSHAGIDVLLLDLSLPDSVGLDTVLRVQSRASRIPIVVLTGLDDEALAMNAVRKGAQDYLVKGQVDGNLLVRSVRYAIERKRTEEQLQRYAKDLEKMVSERTAELANTMAFLNNILESSTKYAIVATDLDGTILSWNTGAKNIFGYKAKEVVEKAKVDIFYEKDHHRGKKGKNLLGAGIDVQTNNLNLSALKFIRKNGEPFPADLTATYLRDAQGRKIGVLGIIKDVTQRKMLERQLIQSEKMAGIGTLAAGIAHEVRNPLSIINNSTYLLREEIIGKTEEVENLLRQIEGGIKRTQTIINNLLDFSRPAVHELEMIDLKDLMEQILSLEGRALSTQNIDLRSDLKDVPKMMGNLDSLKHVFLNLLINAVQSMPQGGTLGIRTYQEDKKVTVEISDTGIGIRKKDLPKIFDPFFSTKEPGEGTGLGLAFVHSEIERMGATIRVDSKPKLGSTFTVQFPLREHESAG